MAKQTTDTTMQPARRSWGMHVHQMGAHVPQSHWLREPPPVKPNKYVPAPVDRLALKYRRALNRAEAEVLALQETAAEAITELRATSARNLELVYATERLAKDLERARSELDVREQRIARLLAVTDISNEVEVETTSMAAEIAIELRDEIGAQVAAQVEAALAAAREPTGEASSDENG